MAHTESAAHGHAVHHTHAHHGSASETVKAETHIHAGLVHHSVVAESATLVVVAVILVSVLRVVVFVIPIFVVGGLRFSLILGFLPITQVAVIGRLRTAVKLRGSGSARRPFRFGTERLRSGR